MMTPQDVIRPINWLASSVMPPPKTLEGGVRAIAAVLLVAFFCAFLEAIIGEKGSDYVFGIIMGGLFVHGFWLDAWRRR